MEKTNWTLKEETRKAYVETLLYENIVLRVDKKHNVAGLKGYLQKTFPNNYVGKENMGKYWKFTIYCGDYETMKFLHEPLKMPNTKMNLRGYVNELKNNLIK